MTAIPTPTEPLVPQVRPAWATALGILGIVIASTRFIDTGQYLYSMLSTIKTDPVASTQPAFESSMRGTAIMTACISVCSCVILLTAAILLLKRKRSSRRLFIIYLALLWGDCILGLGSRVFAYMKFGATQPHGSDIIVYGLLAFLNPYPIFYTIWFFRPTIAREMASWQ